MTIEEHIAKLKNERAGKSFAFLAERVETSSEAPHRINVAKPISLDEAVVAVLAGSGGQGDNIGGYNGYLKKVDKFIKNHHDLRGKSIRVCVAVCNFGNNHKDKIARRLKYLEHSNATKLYKDELALLDAEKKAETLNPAYINDIFEQLIEPRIAQNGGTQRRPLQQAEKYIRRLIFVTHCHGAYVALELERLMENKMTELGYSHEEQNKIFKQLMVLNYAPDCPQTASRAQFVSFESAADDHNQLQTSFKEYLQMSHIDFSLCRMPKKDGNIFMCRKIDKSGIEGNPRRTIILTPIEELWDNRYQKIAEDKDPQPEKTIGEHSFLGFEPLENMSNCAKKMQVFANNILKNSVLNSLAQTKHQNIPLPSVKHLAVESQKQYFDFARAYLTNYRLSVAYAATNQKKLNNFIYQHQTQRIDLSD